MENTLERDLASLRGALKACSFALVPLALGQMIQVVLSIQATGRIWDEIMGGAAQPWILGVSDFLADKFLFILILFLFILVACLVLTIRARGGAFLYANVGTFIVIFTLNMLMIGEAQQMLRAPLEAMSGP